MTLATRLLLRRDLGWTGIALAATSLLVLLVDWVEHGSRVSSAAGASPAVMESLRLALLLLPSHISRALPIVVALGAALTVMGLRRSGEWQALGAAGLGPGRLLAPFALLGGLGGLAGVGLDAWVVPATTGAHARAMAAHEGRPLRQGTGTWLTLEGLVFRLEGEPASGRLGPASALELSSASGASSTGWQSVGLQWRDGVWEPEDPGSERRLPADASLDQPAPWTSLPAPPVLAELIGPGPSTARSWRALRDDPQPSSHAERHARSSRPLAAPLAALVAAALCALLTPGSITVLLAAAPVLVWELFATVAQSQAALGHLPPSSIPVTRLGLGLLAAVALWCRLRRC